MKKHTSSWFPFLDTRIFPDIISFKCVKGPARLFLELEIVLALLVEGRGLVDLNDGPVDLGALKAALA